jgi:thiol-disulfide isomerase/thioredoxin
MRTRSWSSIAVLLLAIGLAGACGRGGEPPEPAEGTPYQAIRPAPDFALDTLDGDTLTLADFDDSEAVLMNFWASWCLPCKTEMPEFIAIHEEYRDQGLAVLGVTVNDLPRDSRAFVEEMKGPYPSVIGTPAMLEAYGLTPWLPITLLIQDGQIVREWVGPQTRADLEYPIRVAVGLAPPIEDVIRKDSTDGGR